MQSLAAVKNITGEEIDKQTKIKEVYLWLERSSSRAETTLEEVEEEKKTEPKQIQ